MKYLWQLYYFFCCILGKHDWDYRQNEPKKICMICKKVSKK